MLSPEEELLDSTALSVLRQLVDDAEYRKQPQHRPSSSSNALRNLQDSAQNLHDNSAKEKDGDDKDGNQGGQDYVAPSFSPTPAPSSSPTPRPTWSPTEMPTRQGQKYVIMGTTWYDRNGNGKRDSNKEVRGLSGDVEFSHAVAGVQINLIECDPSNGQEYIPKEGDEEVNTQASTTTAGLDALGKPQIVERKSGNGMYKIVIMHGLQRHYMIHATAPVGYLITTGACDDAVPGFTCDYAQAVQAVTDEQRSLQAQASASGSVASGVVEQQAQGVVADTPPGIREGRSDKCVYINREGGVEFPINFGVMRVGDSREVGTNIALMLEFDSNSADASVASGEVEEDEENAAAEGTPPALRGLEGRRLEELVRRATVVDETDNGVTRITRYLLDSTARATIGSVTAEILATTLDRKLADQGVDLDTVDPKEVIVETTRPSSGAGSAFATAELAVAMEIKGHYSPPPDLDFDYIVQSSINRDTTTIRRGLREFNDNCREQKSKVSTGYTESDFSSVVDTSGASRPGGRGGVGASKNMPKLQGNNLYSTACAQQRVLPSYFETSLKEIAAKDIAEVGFHQVNLAAKADEDGAMAPWAMGPIAATAGLIALLVGAFVFRRAIGPRYVDNFKTYNETKEIDMDEKGHFGEDDNASVDSGFYSSDEELDEKGRDRKDEKGRDRKARRKRKQKDDMAKGKAVSRRSPQADSSRRASRVSSKSLRAVSSSLRDSLQEKSSSRSQKKALRKLAASGGSDDTALLDKESNSFDAAAAKEEEEDERQLKKKRARERKAKNKGSGTRRGRDKSKGGDNAKLAQAYSDDMLA